MINVVYVLSFFEVVNNRWVKDRTVYDTLEAAQLRQRSFAVEQPSLQTRVTRRVL